MGQIKVKLRNGDVVPMSYPDDWGTEQIEQAIHESFPGEEENSSEVAPTPFNGHEESVQEEPERRDRTGVLGVASDFAHSLNDAAKFALDTPNKLEKSGKYIEEHPGKSILHNAGQLLAETGDIGKGLLNAPYNLNQYLARKHLLPQVLGKLGKMIPHLPEDMGIESSLGLAADKSKGDDLIRAIPDIAALGTGAVGLGKGIRKAIKAPDLQQSIRNTQSKVNAATEKSGKIFDHIEDTLEKEGKNIIDVDKDLVDKAKSMLSNKFNNIIAKAKTGDYKALRKLQSSLGAKERKGLASGNLGDIDQAENIGVIRDDINQTIQQHLEDNGFEDLAKALNKNRVDYADIQKTYFSTPQLAKVFGKSQKVPKKPMTLLTEESTEMKRFMSAHPEVKSALTKALKHQNKVKAAKGIGGILGIGTTAEVAREVLGGR